MTNSREIELMQHIKVLRAALEDAPHSSVIRDTLTGCVYESWYRQQRGPALESTDPERWKPYKPSAEGSIPSPLKGEQ